MWYWLKKLFVDKRRKDLKKSDYTRIKKNYDDTNQVKKKAPSKMTSSKKTESWYCAFAMKMQKKMCDFVQFVAYMYAMNMLDKEDTNLFNCPKSVQ